MILTVLITHINRILKSPIFFRFLAIVRFTDLEPECVLFFLSACITSNCLFDIISQKIKEIILYINQSNINFIQSLIFLYLFFLLFCLGCTFIMRIEDSLTNHHVYSSCHYPQPPIYVHHHQH